MKSCAKSEETSKRRLQTCFFEKNEGGNEKNSSDFTPPPQTS